MNRPDPIQYAERLYAAIRAANFSPLSFLAFGNAVKDGIDLRRMPRIAAEPFMRVVGEMLDLEEETAGEDIIDAVIDRGARSDGSRGAAANGLPAPTDENVGRVDGAKTERATIDPSSEPAEVRDQNAR